MLCTISLRFTNQPNLFDVLQITCAGKCSVRQGVQPVALELHICEYRLRMSDTFAVISPSAEISLLDGDTVLLEDATRVRDERGGKCSQMNKERMTLFNTSKKDIGDRSRTRELPLYSA